MVIGSLWVPTLYALSFTEAVDELKRQADECHEIKWNAATKKTAPLYREVINLTSRVPQIRYRAIIVDQRLLDHHLFNNDDPEIGFYKFYYQLLFQEIACRYQHLMREDRYVIHPDERSDRQAERVRLLQDCLNTSCRTQLGMSYSPVASIDPLSSRKHVLMQVSDLWTGAIGASKNRSVTSTVKLELLRYVETRLHCSPQTLHLPSKRGRRAWFNVWTWKPSPADRAYARTMRRRP